MARKRQRKRRGKRFSGAICKNCGTNAAGYTFVGSTPGAVKRPASACATVVSKQPASPNTVPKDKPKIVTESYNLKITRITSKGGTYDFLVDSNQFVHVYTDGACKKNGRRNASAGIGVYFDEDHPLNKAEPVVGRQTNNSAEIYAAIKAIELAHEYGINMLCINTDSQFVMNGACLWMPKWKANDWKLSNGSDVQNTAEFRKLDQVMNEHRHLTVKWNYVPAHRGILGNERADQLAKKGAQKRTYWNYN